MIINILSDKIKGKKIKVVFPEGNDARIQGAAVRLYKEDLLEPILLGDVEKVGLSAKENGFDLNGIQVIDPNYYEDYDEMVAAFVERRKGKATEEEGKKILLDVNYFGTMLVYMNKAAALVSGAVGSTSDTVRPALQIIKTKPGNSLVSGAFLMLRESTNEKYLFGDCAINISPDASQLADIAIQTAETAPIFDIDPKVAMLSFSTKGSASSPEQEKVAEATKLAQEKAPHLNIDGELQFDAAFVETVGKKKAPDSPVAGKANVFVFPEIQSGNIGYKIAQRLGNFEAIGPVLQGLNKPVSDLSRGCVEEDVYKLAIITANQTLLG